MTERLPPSPVYPPQSALQEDTYHALIDVVRDVAYLKGEILPRSLLNRVELVLFALEHPRPENARRPVDRT